MTLVHDYSLLHLTFACQSKKVWQEVVQKRLAQLALASRINAAAKHAQIEAGQSMKKLRAYVT